MSFVVPLRFWFRFYFCFLGTPNLYMGTRWSAARSVDRKPRSVPRRFSTIRDPLPTPVRRNRTESRNTNDRAFRIELNKITITNKHTKRGYLLVVSPGSTKHLVRRKKLHPFPLYSIKVLQYDGDENDNIRKGFALSAIALPNLSHSRLFDLSPHTLPKKRMALIRKISMDTTALFLFIQNK